MGWSSARDTTVSRVLQIFFFVNVVVVVCPDATLKISLSAVSASAIAVI